MSSDSPAAGDGGEQAAAGTSVPSPSYDKQKEKARVSRTSLILWHAHQNDAAAVRKLLEEDPTLVHARDYDKRTPLHVASLHGWIDVVKCLFEFGADVNAQDRWKNTPLADAEGARKMKMIELLKFHGGLSYNEKAITEEVANGSLYEEADKVISGRLFRGSGCLKGTAITAVVVAAAGAVAAVFLSSNPEATTELINLVDSYANVIITTLKN
ncbi:Serine/threonine-protein kinase VIK [Cardamine amara subsp. amara]|uniref:Serine/threonine-protein kinase VIK n=1 Tax=Cardamine amara subsp. amara TaxID=228776 RepID=A0ABD1BVI7_CARAN